MYNFNRNFKHKLRSKTHLNSSHKKSSLPYSHTHPYSVFSYLYRFAFLLIFPVIQSLLFNPTTLTATIANLGLNILFVIILVILSFMEYQKTTYCLHLDHLHIKKGVFTCKYSKIAYSKITSIVIKKNVLPSLFACAKIYIETAGNVKRKNDFLLILSYKRANLLLNKIYPLSSATHVYKSSIFRIFLMALTWSNSVTGLLFFAPFVKNLGVILGKEFSKTLYDGVNFAVYIASIGLPPTTAYIAGILIFGFAIAFTVQIFRYGRFSVCKHKTSIIIRRGLIARSIFATTLANINAFSTHQSILMLIFNLQTVYIHTIGLGKTKGEKNMLISAESSYIIKNILSLLIPPPCEIFLTLRPKNSRIFSFLYLPLFALISIIPLYYILISINIYKELLNLILVFLLFLLSIWLIFRVVAFKRTSLSITSKEVIATGFKKLNIIETTINLENLQSVLITQTIFQKFSKSCNVNFYIFAENRTFYTVKHLDYFKTIDIVSKINLSS